MVEFFIGVAVFIAALGGVYWRWAVRVNGEIAEGAAVEWRRLQETDPDIIAGYNEAGFARVYRRVHFPRFPKYALAAIVAFALALPFVFAILSAIFWAGQNTLLLSESAALAKYLPISGPAVGQGDREQVGLYLAQNFFGFFYFFGVLAAWLGIVAVAMHRYHSRRPGYLREELIRQRIE